MEEFKMGKSYDFAGWATKHNIRCADGRTIKEPAFKDQDGTKVPLVYNHSHNDINNVLGYAILKHSAAGMYAYCYLNDTEQGRQAKIAVEHGDINSLSIYANQLKQHGGDVIHGKIRELSLVLAGANPGAYIDDVVMHSENSDGEATIYNDSEELELSHAEENNPEEENNNVENQEENVELQHAEEQAAGERTVQNVVDDMTEEQKQVLYFLIGQAIEDAKNNGGNENMKHNVFENDEQNAQEGVLTHADLDEIIANGKKCGSLATAFNDYCLAHSITNIENLFPDSKLMPGHPVTLNDDDSWVAKVMNAIHHVPFAKVKSMYFDITGDEARARGYVKGDQKVDEVIEALQRETTPQTVYKHQSLDRDDIVDITSFDVVAYLKAEMRGKLEEELARAFLIGDGRSISSQYKIKPANIRPILGDDTVYSVPLTLDFVEKETEEVQAKRFIKLVKKNRKLYKGKGNPTLFTTEDYLSTMLCIEDTNGRVIYETPEQLAKAMRVKEIVTVPPMDGATRTADGFTYNCIGIMVNLDDYAVGADKGGAVNMFDDFDIDYNKYKYLIETRCSGALVTPKSALTFELKKPVATSA